MPPCIPHTTGGGACKPGSNSKGLSTASWWVNHQSLFTDLLQVQTHKCETWVGQTVRILTFRSGGKRSDMQSRRFKQGDVNVDCVRIILNRAPYTCLATANDQATIARDFAALTPRISEALAHLSVEDAANWECVRQTCESVAQEMVQEYLVNPSLLSPDQYLQVQAAWVRADEWARELKLSRLEEAIVPLREHAQALYAQEKKSAYNHWTCENLQLQYLLSRVTEVQQRALARMREV